MEFSKKECLEALSKVNENQEAFNLIELFIKEHFAMMEHMKETSLYDVFMYEKRFCKDNFEPMRIIANDNKNLKKEVNGLRKKLGLSQKYKED